MNDGQESSLELLLDTITNAFGGILFIALLVIVLLQLTNENVMRKPPTREMAGRLVAMENELVSTERERDQLLRALVIHDQLAEQLVTDDNRRELETLTSARSSSTELNSRRLELAESLVGKQNEINAMAQTVSEMNDRLKLKSAEVDDEQRKLRAEVQSRTTTAKLPRLHETAKIEIAVVLRFGRLYFIHRYDAALTGREVNTDDMVIVDNGADGIVATPKPYRGTPVDNGELIRATIRDQLRRFPAQTTYLAIAVWDDSFDQFIELKNALVELGYEYRVIPLLQGQAISESNIATPLVQ
jgi:hypothetical protein